MGKMNGVKPSTVQLSARLVFISYAAHICTVLLVQFFSFFFLRMREVIVLARYCIDRSAMFA